MNHRFRIFVAKRIPSLRLTLLQKKYGTTFDISNEKLYSLLANNDDKERIAGKNKHRAHYYYSDGIKHWAHMTF